MKNAHDDLKQRGHARTNYRPEEIIDAYEAATTEEERSEIRELVQAIDGGRFHPFLNNGHNVLAKSDLKRRDTFEENYSDHLLLWIKAFGTVEDLTTFQKVEVECPRNGETY